MCLGDRSRDELLADRRLGGPYLTLLRGLRFERENVDWAVLALPVLCARIGWWLPAAVIRSPGGDVLYNGIRVSFRSELEAAQNEA